MAASVVTVDRNQKASVLPILKGFGVTLKIFFDSLFRRETSTIEFPEQKRNVSSRYRGIHVLTEREDGTPKCVACYMCATACPAECIYIEAGERPEKTIEKYPTRFEIDLLRCVYCGFCVDACPEEAIIMSRENDLVGTTRAELIIDRDRLMARNKLVEHGPGYRPADHDVRRPVRLAALDRLKTEHGIVPGMPRRSPLPLDFTQGIPPCPISWSRDGSVSSSLPRRSRAVRRPKPATRRKAASGCPRTTPACWSCSWCTASRGASTAACCSWIRIDAC